MKAGHDYIGVGVGAMVFNAEGQVFFAKRGEAVVNEMGRWEFPGGRVQYGETMVEAVKREFQEEYGIEIEVVKPLGFFDHILTEEEQHWVAATYIARHLSGVPHILEPQKCSAIGWFQLSEPPAPLSQITKDSLDSYWAMGIEGNSIPG